MDFDLSEGQLQLRKTAHEFAEEHIRPVAAHYDQVESYPWDVLNKAFAAGLYGLDFFESQRLDPTGLVAPVVSEELAWGCGGIALALLSSRLPYYALALAGTQGQLAEWGPRMFGGPGDPKVAAFALTEPQAGSDVGAIATSATLEGGGWVLSGEKIFVTNGGIADVHVVVATVDPALGTRGHALFIVPSGTPGFSQGPKGRKLGVRASHTCGLYLDEVRIPAGQVLGGVEALNERLARAGAGEKPVERPAALRAVEATRPLVAAQAVGVARAGLQYAVAYAHERRQFGRPIIENEVIAHRLARIATEIEGARLLVYRAASAGAAGAPGARQAAAAAKLMAAEVAQEAADAAVQVLGGRGYMNDFPAEKWYRDARVYSILEGTSEVQSEIISRQTAETVGGSGGG